MNTVRVYNGGGSIKTSVALMIERLKSGTSADIVPIDSHEICGDSNWNKTASHIIFAGTSVRGFKKALGPKGLAHLYNAVAQDGVTYVGVCAGAAFAAQNIVYNVFEDGKHKKLENQGLGFFNGYARGPIKEIAGSRPYENTLADIHVIDVRRFDRTAPLKAAYWSGPKLIPPEQNGSPDFKVTSFLDGQSVPLSMVGKHGNGSIVLYAFHPEIALWNYRQWIYLPNPSDFERAKMGQMDAHLDGKIFERFVEDIGLARPQKQRAEGFNLSAL